MMIITEPVLFLRYAVPCGDVLARRGSMSKERLAYLDKCAVEGKAPEGDLEQDFPIGVRMLMLVAKRMGKDEIDSEVIRGYFWKEHKNAIEWRAKMFPDIDVEKCAVKAGKVIKLEGQDALMEIGDERVKVNRKFEPNINEGDWAIIHYGCIAEKVSQRESGGIWTQKISSKNR